MKRPKRQQSTWSTISLLILHKQQSVRSAVGLPAILADARRPPSAVCCCYTCIPCLQALIHCPRLNKLSITDCPALETVMLWTDELTELDLTGGLRWGQAGCWPLVGGREVGGRDRAGRSAGSKRMKFYTKRCQNTACTPCPVRSAPHNAPHPLPLLPRIPTPAHSPPQAATR